MSFAPLRVSPSLAAVTAVTRVERTGLLDAAVATGAVAMPWKLPAPVAGTAEQAAPNVVPSIIAALADGSAADAIGLAAVVGTVVAAGAVVAPALEHAPTKAAAMRRPA